MMLRHMMELHDWSYVGLVRGYISIQTAHPFEPLFDLKIHFNKKCIIPYIIYMQCTVFI